MAGDIHISDRAAWTPASWVYNAVVEGSAKELSESNLELSGILLNSTTEINAGYFNYEKLSADNQREFRGAVQRVYEAYTANPDLFGDPEFYPGFMDRMRDLIAMLEEDSLRTG
jgi:hypothetical protein